MAGRESPNDIESAGPFNLMVFGLVGLVGLVVWLFGCLGFVVCWCWDLVGVILFGFGFGVEFLRVEVVTARLRFSRRIPRLDFPPSLT